MIDLWLVLEWVLKSVILFFILATGFAYTTFYERKFAAKIQIRVGPNRVGPGGWLQPAADGIKLFFKEELIPAGAYKAIFLLAPILTAVPAFVIMAVVPWGGNIELFGRTIPLHIADINLAILYILSVASISVYGIVLAGWSSNNKYAMLGGLRSSAQMISYELALGLSFVGPILLAGSMGLGDIIEAQRGVWYIFLQPIAAFIFYVAALAEVNRAPFDMPEAEQELTAGYHTEYSGMKFALFFMGEYIKMIAVSAIFASLFLGGFRGPFVDQIPVLGPIYLVAKIFVSLGVMIWIRATLPRLRYDRLMAFGWKVLLPLSLLNVFITAVVIVLLGL
jgi:NADH-quinone oxidoreductase subunit H